MAATGSSGAELSPLKRALIALEKMQARIDALERERHEPIAIVGMSCRFPGGADSPDAFWQLLVESRDAIGEYPAGRPTAALWHGQDDETFQLIRQGGFLDGVEQFDPGFFGMSAREAEHADPQQRLMLLVACEALEAAGVPLEALAGTSTGVFVGVHSQSSDYYLLQTSPAGAMDTYTGTGTAHSIIANRLSYLFDLRGPSMSVDTACSSSLVAVHLAVQSLRNRECSMALAGGVNLILSPEASLTFAKLEFLSPEARCKTFDANADGFVRAEGCAAIVLKRLSDAERDGDPILAVIAGSAVNQDGATNGLTAPNSLSQQAVIRRAADDAGIDPSRITLVETHGTGTPLGDPIEVEALRRVLGPTTRCALGAVKTAIGHTEAAAGIAGVIKAVLALQHRTIPPNVHFDSLNPHIELAGSALYVPTAATPWEVPEGERYAGVSSFGFGGTNGHVILREAPHRTAAEPARWPAGRAFALPLAARSESALDKLVERWDEFLRGDGAAMPLHDLLHTASTRRSRHPHRLVLVCTDGEALHGAVAHAARGTLPAGAVRGKAPARAPSVAFVFSGQGAQWWGMGRELLDSEPVFRAAVEQCAAAMAAHVRWDLLEELRRDETDSRLGETEIAQPAIFALQIGLAALWRACGVEPEAVLGHSVGEIAAAHVGGILSLEDAVRVVCHRGRLMQRATGRGRMAAVELGESAVAELVKPYGERVSIAAVNGPSSTVVSGDEAAVEALVGKASARGARTKWLAVDYAFHSAQMDPFAAELTDAVSGIQTLPAQVAVYSTVRGARAATGDFGATYWARNMRSTVRFAAAVEAVLDTGVETFVEFSPQPVLSSQLLSFDAAGKAPQVVASLRRGRSERAQMLESLAALFVAGAPVDWSAVQSGGRVVPLPTYPWQLRACWLTRPRPEWSAAHVDGRAAGEDGGSATADSWYYEVAWQARSLRGALDLRPALERSLSAATLAGGLEPLLSDTAGKQGLSVPGATVDEIEELSACYIAAAMVKLGADLTRAAPIDVEQLGIAPRHHRLCARLVDILGAAGMLRPVEDAAVPFTVHDLAALDARADALALRCPAHAIELGLVRRCGAVLAQVLRGETDPLELLFPVDSEISAERLYKDSDSARVYNALVAEAVARVAESLPAGRVLRVLEIGAGTGGTTAYVLDRLPAERTEYFFTDLSPSLLKVASEKFGEYRFVRYEPLDLEADPAEQGFAPRQFDLILAANVVHATADLRRVVGHVRDLLVPGGTFLLLETTAARRWVDMTFGLLEGWWRFEDSDLRTRHPLLARDEWLALLREAGLTAEAVAGGPVAEEHVFEQHLLVARAPAASVEEGAAAAASIGHASAPAARGVWWVLADEAGIGDALARRRRALGGDVLVVRAGTSWAEHAPHTLTVRPEQRSDLDRVIEHARRVGLAAPEKVIHCWALDAAAPESLQAKLQPDSDTGSQPDACAGLLNVVQALEAARLTAPPRLHLVTRGAQHVDAAARACAPEQAVLLGFGRSLALEIPELWGGAVDLDPEDDAPHAARCLAAALEHGDGEDETAWRAGVRFIPRLERVTAPAPAALDLDPAGAYLVTGGLGGLGLKVALWLAEAGARHIVLVSRKPLQNDMRHPDGAVDAEAAVTAEVQRRLAGVQALEARGVRVEVAAGDIADADFVTEVLDSLAEAGIMLRGIVHAAADIGFRSVREMNAAALAAMLRPKVQGGRVLHELTRDRDLDFFVAFSSSTSLLGSHGLAHYGAANAFLDALAAQRRAAGLPALTVNWGTWDEMRVLDTAMRERAEGQGLRPMDSDRALDALGRLIGAGRTQQLVADIDWDRVPAARTAGGRPLLERLVRSESKAPDAGEPGSRPRLRDELVSMPADERLERAATWVEGEVRDLLRVPPAERVDRTQGLFQIGMDSLMAVQLRERFERAFECAFPATLAFNHSTVEALARFLVEEALGKDVPSSSAGSPRGQAGRDQAGRDQAERYRAERERAEAARDDQLEIEAMSDEDARRLLEQELDGLSMDAYE